MPQNLPISVTAARAACATLDDAQRVALANELIRNVQSEHCVLQLRCLSTMAAETAHELAKRGQVRRASGFFDLQDARRHTELRRSIGQNHTQLTDKRTQAVSSFGLALTDCGRDLAIHHLEQVGADHAVIVIDQRGEA